MQRIHSQSCPICKSETHPFFEDNNNLLACRGCNIVFDTKVSLSRTFYEQERVSHINEDKIKARKRNVKQRVSLLKNLLKKDYSLLEIGCGEGLFIKEVQKLVSSVKGIEPTILYATYAKNTLNLDVQPGVIEDIDFPPMSFNIITIFHVLEHLQNPAEVLRKAYSWLKPEGILIIEVPNIESPYARYKGENWEMINPEHKFYFSPNSLKYLLEENHFELISMKARDFDQYRTGIGKNLSQLGLSIGKSKSKKITISNKSTNGHQVKGRSSILKHIRRVIQLPLKAFLGWLVMKLKRSDYLFVIAKKV